MQKNLSIFVFIIFVITCGFSCSSSSGKSRRPVTKISITPKANFYRINDSIIISCSVNVKNGKLKESSMYLGDSLILNTSESKFSAVLKISSVGKQQIKVVALKTDGVKGENYFVIEAFSDIIPEEYGYEIVKEYPHNIDHYTQGFEIHDGKFYESTGLEGKSAIYRFDLATNNIYQTVKLEDKYFGEGITILNDKIYQITYHAQKGFIYDLESFARIDSFTYKTKEGWGLTNDGKYIIKSDGSEFIDYINPENMQVIKRLAVYDDKRPVYFLNELEYDNGFIYANVYTTNYIVKIDASCGKIVGKINLKGLDENLYTYEQRDVLNGIAIDKSNGKMYVTGKLWPKIFEIKIKKE